VSEGLAATSCVACGQPAAVPWFVQNRPEGTYTIQRCRACDTAFVWPRPDEGQVEAYYRESGYGTLTWDEFQRQQRAYFPSATQDARRILRVCRRLAAGERLLDIGAGCGVFSREAARLGFKVTACEPNPRARDIFARVNGFNPLPDMFDEHFAERREGSFDVLLASQLLEHVADPAGMACRMRRVLAADGLVAVAVPHFGSVLSRLQGRRDMYISPPEHLNFLSRAGLVRLFARSGFHLLRLTTVSKVNRARLTQAVGVRGLAAVVWLGLYAALAACELFGRGMVINAYFRVART